MSILLHGDCLEEMKELDDNSVDFIFCDLPYGQTSCKWDCCIDLEKFWIEIMRIKKLNTPIFMTTTTKFGVSLINSAPKKCPFRYDLVWVKSAPAGFLSAKKMPMRKHEMIYVFYEKLPFYDLSSHKHKFIKANIKNEPTNKKEDDLYGIESGNAGRKKGFHQTQYDPPLPVSVVKQEPFKKGTIDGNEVYKGKKVLYRSESGLYDPPLPVSVVKEEEQDNNKDFSVEVNNSTYGTLQIKQPITSGPRWDPPLPVSVVKEEKTQISKPQEKDLYGASKGGTIGNVHGTNYDPPLPVSVVKQNEIKTSMYQQSKTSHHSYPQQKNNESIYEPPLPNSMLEIKSTRGKHSTEKPVALMEWLLKYFSKEGDVVLDPTMGSGSTGVACKNMNRDFIGIEMDDEIFEVACERVWS